MPIDESIRAETPVGGICVLINFMFNRAARSDSLSWRELPWRATNISGARSLSNRGKSLGSRDTTKSYWYGGFL